MNCANTTKVVLSSMVLSCFCLLPAAADNWDMNSFEPSSLNGSAPATVIVPAALPAPEDTPSIPVVTAPIPVMPWDNPNVPPDVTGTFGNTSAATGLNGVQNGQTFSNAVTYAANPLAIQTFKQSITSVYCPVP